MSLNARLALVFAIGFAIQCGGGVLVAGGRLGGLCLTVSGSIFMGFALGLWKGMAVMRRALVGSDGRGSSEDSNRTS